MRTIECAVVVLGIVLTVKTVIGMVTTAASKTATGEIAAAAATTTVASPTAVAATMVISPAVSAATTVASPAAVAATTAASPAVAAATTAAAPVVASPQQQPRPWRLLLSSSSSRGGRFTAAAQPR